MNFNSEKQVQNQVQSKCNCTIENRCFSYKNQQLNNEVQNNEVQEGNCTFSKRSFSFVFQALAKVQKQGCRGAPPIGGKENNFSLSQTVVGQKKICLPAPQNVIKQNSEEHGHE